ncbi:MAG: DUF2703 domain-containing protein [Rubrivivax sp.]|nr:DUF2703 domain-containing protein [Rubrivivax sp.]
MKTLPITWKRLVTDGETCPRCGSTQKSVGGAMTKLAAALRPLGIEPALETQQMDEATFRADPSQSNRIWIAGRPMEEWLGASVGMSTCCSVCGDLPCRTMQVGGDTYEAIPEELIIRAAMIAASAVIGTSGATSASSACCAAKCGCH